MAHKKTILVVALAALVSLGVAFDSERVNELDSKILKYCGHCECVPRESKRAGGPVYVLTCDESASAVRFEHNFDAEVHSRPEMYCKCNEEGDLQLDPRSSRNYHFDRVTEDSWTAVKEDTMQFIEENSKKSRTEFVNLHRWSEQYKHKLREIGLDSDENDANERNNYSDVIAYDFNRPDFGPNSYVNGNYIVRPDSLFIETDDETLENMETLAKTVSGLVKNMKPSDPQLIATQGPKNDLAVEPFFRLLSDFGADLVVAVGPAVEHGRTKFQDYFGKVGFTKSSGDFTVTTVSTTADPEAPKGIKLYQIAVKNTKNDKETVMAVLHFEDWMDMEATDVDLTMWASRHMNKYKRVVIHCSAGVGRTGTMVAVNTMYNSATHVLSHAATAAPSALITELKRALDPVRVTMLLKAQRQFMVMRPPQFAMLYETAEKLLNKLIPKDSSAERVAEAAKEEIAGEDVSAFHFITERDTVDSTVDRDSSDSSALMERDDEEEVRDDFTPPVVHIQHPMAGLDGDIDSVSDFDSPPTPDVDGEAAGLRGSRI